MKSYVKMIPQIPALDLNVNETGSVIQDIREVLQSERHEYISLYNENVPLVEEFKLHNVLITSALQSVLVDADSYVWAVVYWLSGCKVVSDMKKVVEYGYISTLLERDVSELINGWPSQLRFIYI